jgi:hypothetical protein
MVGLVFDLKIALLDLTCMRLARPDIILFVTFYGFCVIAGRPGTEGT